MSAGEIKDYRSGSSKERAKKARGNCELSLKGRTYLVGRSVSGSSVVKRRVLKTEERSPCFELKLGNGGVGL